MSSPSTGLIWMVASRAIWVSQTEAVSCTSETAPSVKQDRNVMMAMTKTRALPMTFCSGTIDAVLRCSRSRTPVPPFNDGLVSSGSSIINVEPSAREDHPACVHLFHQAEIVGGDDNRGT